MDIPTLNWFNIEMRFLYGLLYLSLLSPITAANAADDNWPLLAKEAKSRLVTQPTNPELLNLHGYYSYRAGITVEAFQSLEASVRLKPAFPVAWNNLGALYLGEKQYARAETCFRKALQHDPKYSKAKYNLAVTRFKQGSYREALSLYMDLRNEDKAYVDIRSNKSKAEKELDEALKANPRDPFLKTVKARYEKMRREASDSSPKF